MLTIIGECQRDNLCVDCDDAECAGAGRIEADCPKYKCDHLTGDCNNCAFIKAYQEDMRKKV